MHLQNTTNMVIQMSKNEDEEIVGFYGTIGVVGTTNSNDEYVPDSVGRKSDLDENVEAPVDQ